MRETYETWCRTAWGSNSGCHTDCAGCAFGPKLHGWSLTQCQKSPTHESHTWIKQRWYIKYKKCLICVFKIYMVHSKFFLPWRLDPVIVQHVIPKTQPFSSCYKSHHSSGLFSLNRRELLMLETDTGEVVSVVLMGLRSVLFIFYVILYI